MRNPYQAYAPYSDGSGMGRFQPQGAGPSLQQMQFQMPPQGYQGRTGCSVSFQIGRACGQACTIRIPQSESVCSLRLEHRRACTRRGTWSFLCSPPSRNWQRSNSSETKWTASSPLSPTLRWTVGRTWEWLALMMTSTRFVCLNSSRCGRRRT